MKESLIRPKNAAPTITTNTITPTDMERKIEAATEGLPLKCFTFLHRMLKLPGNKEHVLTICDYISSLKSEINPSDYYRRDVIILLCNFLIFFENDKSFKDITREDLLSFLDSFRKIESVDPLHKWIGTYNLYRIHLMRFFKWVYSPDIEYKQTVFSKSSVPDNCIILKGGVLECRDSLTQSISFSSK